MKPLQIGITGGIGSGKSLVCKIFKCLGVPVYDADERAKSLMTSDKVLVSSIKQEFGHEAYDEHGKLNRTVLAKTVFSDPARLEKLNSLVHPRVAVDYARWMEEAGKKNPYVIKEAALLYEAGSYKQLDKIIVVYAPVEMRINRVTVRDKHRTADQIREIVERQWSDEEKLRRADYIAHNDETSLLIPQVIALHQVFRTLVH